MSGNAFSLRTVLKIYVAIVLTATTLITPLSFSWIPLLALGWYLYIWRWQLTLRITLLTDVFLIYMITLLFSASMPEYLAFVPSIPLLYLVRSDMGDLGATLTFKETRNRWAPTGGFLEISILSVLVLSIALLTGNMALFLSSAVSFLCLASGAIFVFVRMPGKPVSETVTEQRMIAGNEADIFTRLTVQTSFGGHLFIRSPYEWLKVEPKSASLRTDYLDITLNIVPPLSGPRVLVLQGQAVDKWGIFRFNFEMEPVRLHVTPRASYAVWMASRYLAGFKPGLMQLITNTSTVQQIHGLRKGIEYYGSRQYQPGDSLKNIDWKHTAMYDELISKEFSEFEGRAAINLINLTAGNEEEADILAYNIVATALSLAREDIPAALAAYNDREVIATTGLLRQQQLISRSIQLTREISTIDTPLKYLNPPDISRLRANIVRTRQAHSPEAEHLVDLLETEYRVLGINAEKNPAAQALAGTRARVDNQTAVVLISLRNHDAEALAFASYELEKRGNIVVSV